MHSSFRPIRSLLVWTIMVSVGGTACRSRAETAPAPAPGTLLVRRTTRVLTDPASIGAFRLDLPAVDGPFECSQPHALSAAEVTLGGMPLSARSILAYFPTASAAQGAVIVTIDSAGNLLRYNENRGPPLRPKTNPNMTPDQLGAAFAAAQDSARRSMISFDFVHNRATLANRGGGRPEQTILTTIDAVGSLELFGRPLDRAARVLASCRPPG